MSAEDELRDLLDRRVRDVDRRVANGGDVYASDGQAIRQAVAAVEGLRSRLRLGRARGDLAGSRGKPQLLLVFETNSGEEVVLKVYGKHRPAEAAVQGLWARHGVDAAVPVLDSGDEPTSWLLMPRVPGDPPDDAAAANLTEQLAAQMARAHRVIGPAGAARTLVDGVGYHLQTVLAAAARHGYRPPAGLFETADELMRSATPTHLHGDLGPANLLHRAGSALRFLDTCGYRGPTEFDAARWAARVGGPERAEELLERWMVVERLDRRVAHGLLGVELASEAGVREIRKDEQGLDSSAPDEGTQARLDLARLLLATTT